jgi:hypothetical protein
MLLSFVEKAREFGLDLAKELDITPIQAAAILGNIGHMSNGAQPNYREDNSYGPAWAKGTIGLGYGWAQWENKRDGTSSLDSFIDFVKANYDTDITRVSATDSHNYAYLVEELSNGNKKDALNAVKKTATIEEATTTFMQKYENPNRYSIFLNKRLNYARQALACMTYVDIPVRATSKNIIES